MARKTTIRHSVSRAVFAGMIVLDIVSSSSVSEASVVSFKAVLSGAAEASPNSSPATGTAEVTIDDELLTMRVQSNFSDLVANVTAAHIHCCTAAASVGTAGVASGVPTFAGFPADVRSGSYDHEFDMTAASSFNPAYITANGGTVSAAFASLLAGLKGGSAYFNIHTVAYPGGEIRGFLETSSSAVPLPAGIFTLMLALAGLVGLSSFRTRKVTSNFN
jgi:CHRD domain